jgi:hypothetical protein
MSKSDSLEGIGVVSMTTILGFLLIKVGKMKD